ncbi:uncharacterized protein [Neodiprion pinetum]|uniref:uncharacterized protein n=1 Tax=Neodiprion pinetum TaxID=441929 RepID=UPI001EE13ED9|nr:uncharacterized protein LOC124223393 isoform X2 [Neodiprion pinetum]
MQLSRKMSAQNMMASISRTLRTRRDSKSAAANEVKFAGEESKDKLYEPKHRQKLVRVLTVVAYVISVSLAAIILSLYYMFIWKPEDRPLNATSSRAGCPNYTSSPPPGAGPVPTTRHPGSTPYHDAIGDERRGTEAATPGMPSVSNLDENFYDEILEERDDRPALKKDGDDASTTLSKDQPFYAGRNARDRILKRK